MSPTIDELLAALLEGELTAESQAALSQHLRGDADLRRRAVRLLLTDTLLADTYPYQTLRGEAPLPSAKLRAGSVGVSAQRTSPPHADAEPVRGRSVWYEKRFRGLSTGFSIKTGAALAALLALAATLLYVFVPFTPHSALPTPHSAAPASYAMLSDMSPDAIFADGERSLGEGLTAPIKLTSGRAQLMFKSTAVVDLTGPCEFEMTGPNRGMLTSGKLEAYCRPEAHGFTVDLPGGAKVVDLGTRFTVVANASGRDYVLVREGRVQISGREVQSPTHLLVTGQIMVCEADGSLRQADISADQELVVDGGFESAADQNAWSIRGNASVIEAGVSPGLVMEGRNALCLNANNQLPNATIEQVLHTIPAVTYRLSFSIAKYRGAAGTARVLAELRDINADRTIASKSAATNRSVNAEGRQPWAFHTVMVEFTATSDRTLLRFKDQSDIAGVNYDAAIDQVSVRPLPPDSPGER
ncbi:MAG: DUF642 domain-containing protein [Planctomycetes bacterium]|nr:DUF642 domain-containing protein [Planctomycetota bacterium]